MSVAKTRISALGLVTEADGTTIIPISQGSPLRTWKISPDDLIKGTASIASKADLSGGNTFSGNQHIGGDLSSSSLIEGRYIKAVDDLMLSKLKDIQFYDDDTQMSVSKLYHSRNLTSDAQAQLNSKANLSGGNTFSGNQVIGGVLAVSSTISAEGDLTIGGVLTSNGQFRCDDSLRLNKANFITFTDSTSMLMSKLFFIKDLTSDAQAQLNGKANINTGNTFVGNQVVDGNIRSLDGNITADNDLYIGGSLVVKSFEDIEFTDTLDSMRFSKLYHLAGVTSDIQTQLNGKINVVGDNILTGDLSSYGNIVAAELIAPKANIASTLKLQSGCNMLVGVAETSVPSGQLAHLSGVSSNIQTQLNSKGGLSSDNTFSGTNSFVNSNSFSGNSFVVSAPHTDINGISGSEISALSGISDNIQSQINGRARLGFSNNFTGANTFTQGIVVANELIANTPISVNNGIIVDEATISNGELKALDGVWTSAGGIQGQLNNLYGNVDLLTNNRVIGSEMHLEVLLTQSGTNAPSMTVLKNTMFAAGVDIIRTEAGIYKITSNSGALITEPMSCDKNNVKLVSLSTEFSAYASVEGSGIKIEVTDNTQTLADDLLYNTYFKFTFYP